MSTKPVDVDEYLSTVPADARATLEALRRTIRAFAPDAVESISYGVPTFKYRGRPLAYFAAAKNHCALYGLNAQLAEEAGYKTSKGTIRFPIGEPPPDALVESLLRERLAALEGARASRHRRT